MNEVNFINRSDPNTHEVAFELVKEYLNKDKMVLDVGCGSDSFLYKVKDLTSRRFGCDFNVDQYAEHDNKENVKKVDLDWEKLPYEQEMFDVIFCLDVLEHLFNPFSLLKECFRVLKNDGIIILSTPNLCNYIQRINFLLTGKLKGFWVKQHKRDLGEMHITPIFKYQLLEFLLSSNGHIIKYDFNRSNVPKLGINLKRKSYFLSETVIWAIRKR